MTDETKKRLLRDIDEMTKLAESYGNATNEILTTDIDETLEDIISRRRKITALIGEYRHDIDEVRYELDPKEGSLLMAMLTGGHVPLGLPKELRDLLSSARKMHQTYLSVEEKEKQAAARVDARVKELRSQLESVTADHRKVKSYSSFGTGIGTGSSFSSKT